MSIYVRIFYFVIAKLIIIAKLINKIKDVYHVLTHLLILQIKTHFYLFIKLFINV